MKDRMSLLLLCTATAVLSAGCAAPRAPAAEAPVPERVVERIVEKPVDRVEERQVIVEKIVERQVVRKVGLALKDIYFAYNSADLSVIALGDLRANAAAMRQNADLRYVLIGSASPEGSAGYNMKLAQRRVKTVQQYLLTQEGVSQMLFSTETETVIAPDREMIPFVRRVRFVIANRY